MEERSAVEVIFRAISILLALLVAAGFFYMLFVGGFRTNFRYAVLGAGFLFNILQAAYYFSDNKKASLIFIIFAIGLGLLLLDFALTITF